MHRAEIISNDAHKCSTSSKNHLPFALIIEENSVSDCQVQIKASNLLMSTLPAINQLSLTVMVMMKAELIMLFN